jgi:hypothetical protein
LETSRRRTWIRVDTSLEGKNKRGCSRDFQEKSKDEELFEDLEAALFVAEHRAEANAVRPQLVDLELDSASEGGGLERTKDNDVFEQVEDAAWSSVLSPLCLMLSGTPFLNPMVNGRLLRNNEDHKDNFKDDDSDGNQYDIRIFLISPTTANPVYKLCKFGFLSLARFDDGIFTYVANQKPKTVGGGCGSPTQVDSSRRKWSESETRRPRSQTCLSGEKLYHPR